MNVDYKPETLNLELTTACPLRCPQCYCTLVGGKHLDYDIAKMRVDEGAALGTEILLLSGGETLCYPHLLSLVEYAAPKIPEIRVALSGWNFDQAVFENLVAAGVTEISISLNGSTEAINSLTRDGYQFALNALALLKKNAYKHSIINWVMHSCNADDFPEMIKLAEDYSVSGILIIGVKPDSHNTLRTYPTKEQIQSVSKAVKAYTGNLRLLIESCFSNMLAYHSETKLFGNLNLSTYKGCGAGRTGISVNVDGKLTPCRHIDATEDFPLMDEYWRNSKYLQQLRAMDEETGEPCSTCRFRPYCRHCAAINWQLNGMIALGFKQCPIYEPKAV